MPATPIPAAPALRKRIVLVALPTFLVCLALLSAFTAYITRLIPVTPALAEQLLIHAFHCLAVFTGLIVTGLVSGIGSLLWKVIKADQYPPPGQQFPWSTTLRIGTAATRPASLGLVILGVLFVAGLIASFFIWQMGQPLPPLPTSPIQMA